jgi:hypothetical protein
MVKLGDLASDGNDNGGRTSNGNGNSNSNRRSFDCGGKGAASAQDDTYLGAVEENR